VRQQARRFNVLAAGRRWRKTTLLMSIAVEAALGGGKFIWGAPTVDQVRIGWNEMRHACAGSVHFAEGRRTATFPNGAEIVFRTLDDPDNARGHTADGVIVDEAEAVKPAAWYEVLRPMLIDTNGWAWLAGTPLGRNWFYTEFHSARDREDAMAWQIPTVGCEVADDGQRLIRTPHPLENPEVPFEEIESIFKTSTLRTFRQEILAEFVEGEGAVFRNITANLWEGPAVPAEHEGHTVVAGVDWGQTTDFTAVSIACRDCMRELYLDRFHGIDYRLQRERIKAQFERWGVSYAIVELNSIGQPNFEDLVYDGVPVAGFETTASSKPPLIESLALSLEKEEVQWLRNATGTAELEAFERTVAPNTGRPRYGAPEGMHDDTVIARALCRKAIDDGGPWAYIL
jgi:hypothetical protein